MEILPQKKEPAQGLSPETSSSGDFILDYIRYADVIEAPPEAHEAVAISLLAAVINEKVGSCFL